MLSEAKHLIAVDAVLCHQRHEILRSLRITEGLMPESSVQGFS